ncbi:MAG: glycine--tRNA ligase [Fimbriimonadaceae bacterium]|nr:glycine--tRNA ligase [Fimbriimonadaceae bacterium]
MVTMDKLVSLCKRRGFIFPSSEIYGGFQSTYDYGPLGTLLKNNIKAQWWKAVVQQRDDMEPLDASILMHPRVWEASGHVAVFNDPLVDCKECKARFRADHLWCLTATHRDESKQYAVEAGEEDEALSKGRELHQIGKRWEVSAAPMVIDAAEGTPQVCPKCGAAGSFTEPRAFNMMFQTQVGPVEGSIAYLRPETAQGIFVNYDNVLTTMRRKLPFGIAQVGKAFRNEIVTGNFTFRTREFEQMEIEYFCWPEQSAEKHQEWIDARIAWYTRLGIARENLDLYEHPDHKRSHYSTRTVDILYRFPIGFAELEGIANRTDFDLSQHAEFSGKTLDYFDTKTERRVVPHVVEPSAGVDRNVLAFLTEAYTEEEYTDQKGGKATRTLLRLHPTLAPIKAAVLPLAGNREDLVATARALAAELREDFSVQYDDTGAIGKLYRRQDEIGTLYCITVDHQTIDDDGKVTIRDRDTMQQVRLAKDEVAGWLRDRVR